MKATLVVIACILMFGGSYVGTPDGGLAFIIGASLWVWMLAEHRFPPK